MQSPPRPIRPLPLLSISAPPSSTTWRLKTYSIAYNRPLARPELIAAAQRTATDFLRTHPTRHTHHSVGFLGIHDGRGECQIFLNRWINENELLHHYWISTPDNPAALRRPTATEADDHDSVCISDLAVECHERAAWIKHILRPSTRAADASTCAKTPPTCGMPAAPSGHEPRAKSTTPAIITPNLDAYLADTLSADL